MGLPRKLKYKPLVRLDEKPEVLAFRGARVFSAVGPEALENHDVIVRSGKIAEVRPSGTELPAGARIIDGANRTLLPGLIDSHVHATVSPAPMGFDALPDPKHNLQEFLYMGVTGIFDGACAGGQMKNLRAAVDSGKIPGPRIFYCAGPMAAKNGYFRRIVDDLIFWPLNLILRWRGLSEVETREEVVHFLNKRIKEGTDAIKVYFDKFQPAYPPDTPMPSQELLKIIVEESHKRDRKVVVHISNARDAMDAARCGIDLLMHSPYQSRLSEEEAHELGEIGIPAVTTGTVVFDGVPIAKGEFQPDEFDRKLEHPDLVAAMTGPAGAENMKKNPVMTRFYSGRDKMCDNMKHNLGLMHRAGVKFLAGTDGSLGGLIGGSSLHRELRYMVESGIPIPEVLLSATSRAARFLDPSGSFGTIEPGKCADLLLVDGNPLANIADTSRIVQVVRDGRLVERLL
ncbi:MAG: amidohydrolase family protein [bacterium]|nr:amidohydrolase family protein [bacterium]